MNKKGLALLLALMLVIGAAVGGTVAWLTAKTDAVVNTFTTSNISIKLEETTTDYKMVPGYAISKDPTVTVLAGSEKCYLFVRTAKSANFDTFLTFTMADGWTQGDGTKIPSDVWYRVVESSSADQEFAVLKDDQVIVRDSVTKADMNGLSETTYPKLTVTAYASQYSKDGTTNFTADEAWANVPPA